ncbi:membrane protein insertion efficiency factor YidD [Wenjunlia vitaminophila]|nr:membrane protein insertion efficiency factor YidD [Wenjunlia vitaminophila]
MHARVLAAVGCAVFGLGPTARRLEREPGAPRGLLARRMHLAVRYYQERISPRYGPRCRYTPTCSAYAVTALRRHGAVRGSVLTWRRLARCTPNGGRGADPVPGS